MADRIFSGVSGIVESLSRMAGADTLRVVLLSPQKRQFCLHEPHTTITMGITFDILEDIVALVHRGGKYDICILCCHNEGDEANLLELRNKEVAKLYFVWFWDNHHHHINNLRTAALADVVFVSHWHKRHYLNQLGALAGVHIPACSRQWSPAAAAHYAPNGLNTERKDGLFGGFGRYQFTPERNAFIEKCQEQFPDNAITLGDVEAYFRTPAIDRFQSWIERKAHLLVTVNTDLSTRLFEALMTGQIPLIPDDVTDLDRVITPELQAALPILRYKPYSIVSAHAAWREALARFDADGVKGIRRRHAFARDHHSLTARLGAFANFIRRPGQFRWGNECKWHHWL